MSIPEMLAISFGSILALMIVLWSASLVLANVSLVDIFWGPMFIIQAVVYNALAAGFSGRKALILVMVIIWGMRLSVHIFLRNHGRGEDFRYQNWRRQYGAKYRWASFFQVFLLQGALSWIIGAPLLLAQTSLTPDSLTALDALGALVWLVGFVFEAGGDAQLTRFKSDPANRARLLRTGLWAYTRHPNYFGDAAQWWGFYLIALAAGGGWTIFSPILMTFLLVRVSGIGMLEKTLAHTKPGYSEYMATTSAFLPWFPRD